MSVCFSIPNPMFYPTTHILGYNIFHVCIFQHSWPMFYPTTHILGYNIFHVCRATDKARKSVITHWKSLKTHWKYKLGVKIRISILRYALGVQCSAYWLSIHVFKKWKFWIVDVNLSVRLSSYCQNTVNIYSSVITSNSKSLPKL